MTVQHDKRSLFLSQLDLRMPKFRRNSNLEEILEELSSYLAPLEVIIEEELDKPVMPPLFLVGNPRSGTSVFMQFLSQSNAFSIPTNLLSRFYYAPFIGGKIQELLTNPKFDFKNELMTENNASNLSSDIGKTTGLLGPSEFFHFWRRFLPRYDPEYLTGDDCSKINIIGLQKGVAAIETVFEKPFAAKAIILQYNIDILRKAFPDSFILHIRRDPIFIMQSILQAREKFYGNRNIWWSVKPKEYEMLKELDVYHQIAGQVYFTDRALKDQLLSIPENNKLIVEYEKFCSEPETVAKAIKQRYAQCNIELHIKTNQLKQLKSRNRIRIESTDIRMLKEAFEYFESFGATQSSPSNSD